MDSSAPRGPAPSTRLPVTRFVRKRPAAARGRDAGEYSSAAVPARYEAVEGEMCRCCIPGLDWRTCLVCERPAPEFDACTKCGELLCTVRCLVNGWCARCIADPEWSLGSHQEGERPVGIADDQEQEEKLVDTPQNVSHCHGDDGVCKNKTSAAPPPSTAHRHHRPPPPAAAPPPNHPTTTPTRNSTQHPHHHQRQRQHTTSYVVRRTSYVVRRTSYVIRRTSYVVRRTSYAVHRTSYVVRST